MKNFYLYIILVSLLFASCGVCRKVEQSALDSIRIELRPRIETIRDTVVITISEQTESVEIRQDSSHLENHYSQSDAVITPDGTLRHTLTTKQSDIIAPVECQVVVRDSVVYREKITHEVQEVERALTDWQRFRMDGFWLLLLLFVVAMLIKF